MKKSLKSTIYIIFSFLIIGCSKDSTEYYTIDGQILINNTDIGADNVQLNLKTYKIASSYNILGGSGSSGSTIEEKNIITNQNGGFSILMEKNNDIRGVTIRIVEDGNYVGLIKDFQINDRQNILLQAIKFETLKIIVKNVNPFDSNDKIKFSHPSDYLIKRENFGTQNESIVDYLGNLQPVNIWLGINVNSELTYKVHPNFTRNLSIYKTKNGIESYINTGQITLIPNQINLYNINY